MTLSIYVPTDPTLPIDPGSAVVGSAHGDGTVTLDFEGNRYGALRGTPAEVFLDCLEHAGDRHATSYPTTARLRAPAGAVTCVGDYDPESGRVLIEDPERLDGWLRGASSAAVVAAALARAEERRQLDALRRGDLRAVAELAVRAARGT